jgi:hypothetical protein
MNNLLRRFFGLQEKPSEVHEIKNKFTREMLQVHFQAWELRKNAQALERRIKNTTAYKVGVATGRIQ